MTICAGINEEVGVGGSDIELCSLSGEVDFDGSDVGGSGIGLCGLSGEVDIGGSDVGGSGIGLCGLSGAVEVGSGSFVGVGSINFDCEILDDCVIFGFRICIDSC